MEDKMLINFQRQQIRRLQEEKKAMLESLDLARELGVLTTLNQEKPSRANLLHEICARANRMIPFKSCAVYLVDEETHDFVQASSYPDSTGLGLEREVDLLIKDQSLAYALQTDGPVFFLDSTGKGHIVLHVLSTPFSLRGMFVGLMMQNKDEIPDTTIKFFSVFMLLSVNALENWETHEFMLNHSSQLERKVQKRTRELADANERLRVTLEGMQAGVVVIKADGFVVVDANPKALEILDMTKEELLGCKCFDVICSKQRGKCPIVDLGMSENNEEFVVKRRDGKAIPIQKAVSPVMIDGELHLVENFIDIIEQKKLADLKEDVGRMMRHDLKSPLNGVIGLPEMLLENTDEPLSESQREILEYIQVSGYKLLNMINLSLDLYKMEIGTYEHRPAVADIYPIFRSAIKDLSELIKYKRIEVRELFEGTEIEEGFSYNVHCDEFLIYSLMSNLLKNAVEASPSGEQIIIEVNPDYGKVIIRIHNQGEVPESIRETFFEKYVTANKSGGTGLGTYSAKLIAETMGGRIYFETSAENGTALFIELPGID
ncbi:ATP-binding protein [Maridesulfovibrio sp.]|uniref:ATP-binding protein n=1 Tax=Maridesulfovibrio sp. TaxID=2795000 RepID=UPI0029F56AF9|nr:ATP-binding protein [Maridesulfovibrio sp.]